MPSSFARDRIDNWVSDFCHGDRARDFKGPVVEYATEVLAEFLAAACDVRNVDPEDVEQNDLKTALLGRVSAMDLPREARGDVPGLCGAFLEDLEAQGRLGGGRSLGVFVRALRGAFVSSSGGGKTPQRRVAPKMSPNEPCPCGSGKKFKRCCAI